MVVSPTVSWLDLVAGVLGCPVTFAVCIFGPWLFWSYIRIGRRLLELVDPEWAYGVPTGPRTAGVGAVGKGAPQTPSEPPRGPGTPRAGLG